MKQLFPDAEIPEDHVQDVLDVDLTGEAAERAAGQPELFGHQGDGVRGPALVGSLCSAVTGRPAYPSEH